MKPPPPQTITEPLTVVMRVRPMNGVEHKAAAKSIVRPVDEKLIVLMDPHDDIDDILRVNRSREKHYVFDHVFSPEASQEDVYCAVVQEKGIIESVLSGYNCTVFAYGATGTGKTHTMLGSQDAPGIMVHTLNSLFKKMEQTKEDTEYQVSMGYLEIYNECVRDLLCPDSGSLELREDASGSITVSNLLDISASSTDVILGMLRMGNTNRTSEPTVANKTSSRSHAILKVNVEQRSRMSNVTQEVRSGSLYMVDLAGSERAAVTQNRGKRMIEGAHINRSLLALANCINALGSNNTNYINYRDSKLTRILKEALGGNCKTIMIAHASPASTSYEETRNTMVYADRSKKIKNKTRQNVMDVNHHVTQYLHIIDELQYQVVRLRGELDKATEGTAESSEVRGLCDELRSLIQDQREIRHKLLEVECQLLQNALEHQKHEACIKEWEQKRDTMDIAPSVMSSPLFIPTTSLSPGNQNGHISDSETLPSGVNDKTGSTLSLKEAGRVANVTGVASPHTRAVGMASPLVGVTSKASYPPIAATDPSAGQDCMVDTGAGGCVLYKDTKPKAVDVSLSQRLTKELLLCVSPDSGTEMSVTVPVEGDRVEMEPVGVASAREGVAMLAATKQSLDAQHQRIEKMLRENRSSVAEVKKKLLESSGFPPIRRDMADLLQYISDLEASHVDHNLSSMLMGIHLSRHTSLLDQLLHHSATLLEMVERHRGSLMEEDRGRSEGSGRGETSDELIWRCGQLSDRHKKLATEVANLKSLPELGNRLQLPSISKLSSKLYTTMTGSKSNLITDEGLSDDDQLGCSFSYTDTLSDDHLPNILSPKHSTTHRPDRKASDITSLSLPPINPGSHVMVAAAKRSPLDIEQKSIPIPLKKSEITQILEAAIKSRDDKIAASTGLDRLGQVRRNARKRATARKNATFVSPRASIKGRYSVPQQTMEFQPKTSAKRDTGNTEVIDLESTDVSASLAENLNTNHLQEETQTLSLQGQNTRSQPHLASKIYHSKLSHTQRLRRSRSHARIASPSSETVEKREGKAKSVSMEDVSSKHSSPVHREEKKPALEKKTSSSRPIVKKLNYIKQSSTKQTNKGQTQSVYSGRPYVIPVAKRIIQHSKSPYHQAGMSKSTKRKKAPLNPLRRKHQPVARQELSMAKVKPGGQFSFASPYISSSFKQGNKTRKFGTNGAVSKAGMGDK